MGIVLAFAVGYFVGANAGQAGYQEVIEALHAVRESAEFEALIEAMRAHAAATLQELSVRVGQPGDEPLTPASALERVRDLIGKARLTSPAS